MAEIKWQPKDRDFKGSNIFEALSEKGFETYQELFKWSVEKRGDFWEYVTKKLEIEFQNPPSAVLDESNGPEHPEWFPGAKLNIVDSCFRAPTEQPAIVFQKPGNPIETISYQQLDEMSAQVANSLENAGFKSGDALAIDMPMTIEAVGIYLGIIRMGGIAVSIADSFAPEEIAIRLKISKAVGIFTQDYLYRGDKVLPMYEKVQKAHAPRAIVVTTGNQEIDLRKEDIRWEAFLTENKSYTNLGSTPNTAINILFSSGTTGDPKAIPWTQITPIKNAMDGLFHLDIHVGEVVAWPTNLGWMMGPWLIFASLLNKATMALYYDVPMGKEFGKFVQEAKVSMLGLVPSMVKAWRASRCMEGMDWSAIKCFASTGECSNADDYAYLMDLAGNRPVMEYCGGTEIGGGYISGTLVQPAAPAHFTTPTLGLDFVLLDEQGKLSDNGEVYLVPPSIGLSQTLLNRDHHEVYFKGTPKGPNGELLRRHGDQLTKQGPFYQGLGRVDDTMNLGGIKTSSAEIERTLNQVEGVKETAAIAVPPKGGGPSLLIIYAVMSTTREKQKVLAEMQTRLKSELNPLFKIEDLCVTEALPRTASNKVMRRVLRSRYQAQS